MQSALRRMVPAGWMLLVACLLLVSSAPVAASTYTARGTVVLTNGTPVQNRSVTIRVAWVSGGANTHTVTTNSAGEFSKSWSAAYSTLNLVTVTVNGGTNLVTGGSARQMNWYGGGTRNFGFWTLPWVPPLAADDLDRDGIDDDHEDNLLAQFAPKIWLHSQETRKPVNVDWIFPRVHMNYHHRLCSDDGIIGHGQVNENNITEQCHQDKRLPFDGWPWEWCDHDGTCNQSDAHLAGWKGGFFLQYYNSSHWGSSNPQDWTLYGHVYPGENGQTVVQYWQAYSYNESLGPANHEGDWEYVAVVVGVTGEPVKVYYYMHGRAQDYLPGEVSWEGDHVVTYTAEGSHAQYKGYSGWPIRCDATGWFNEIQFYDDQCDQGTAWNSWDSATFGGIVNVGERDWQRNDSGWLRYTGRWGEYGFGSIVGIQFTSGPHGPAQQWDHWHIDGATEVCANLVDDDVDGWVDEPPCNAAPDLVVTENEPAVATDGVGGPVVVVPGEVFPVRCGLANLGGQAFPTFGVDFYLSADTVLGPEDYQISSGPVLSGMARTSTYPPLPTWEVTVPASTPVGKYHVLTVVDGGEVVAESDETNNSRFSENLVRVVPAPGLETLFVQNFHSQAAPGFSPVAGTWNPAIEAYKAVASGPASNDTVSLVSVPSVKTRTEVDVSVRDWDGADNLAWGVVQRYVDATHFLRVDATRDGDTTLFRLVEMDGTESVLATGTYSGDPTGETTDSGRLDKGVLHAVVEDTGSHLCVHVHDEQVIRVPYSSGVGTGTQGLFVNTGNTIDFDNVYVSRLPDADGDGWTTCEGDCDDNNWLVHPGRAESCSTNYDDDCDGTVNEGCGGGGCFAAGTGVTMADGSTRPIESVAIGDEVLSFDTDAGSLVTGTVVQVFVHESSEPILAINGALEATANHEFYVSGDWVRADALRLEDVLTGLDPGASSGGLSTTIELIRTIETIPAKTVVYNIEVDSSHNYFAGGVLVHNKPPNIKMEP